MYLSKYLKVIDTASNLMHKWALKLFYAPGWLIKLSVKNDKYSILTLNLYNALLHIKYKWKAHLVSYYLSLDFWQIFKILLLQS